MRRDLDNASGGVGVVLLAHVLLGKLGLAAFNHGRGSVDHLSTTVIKIRIQEENDCAFSGSLRSNQAEKTAGDTAGGNVRVELAVSAAVALDGETVVGAEDAKGDENQLKGELHDGLAHVRLGVLLGQDAEGRVEEHETRKSQRKRALQTLLAYTRAS